MTTKMDRGEYRSCYTAMADDLDIHAMSGNAFKLLWMLKLTLPTAGIGVVYPTTLADQVGVSPTELEQLFVELSSPKAGSDRGWIARDRNIVWLVNALACEPGMKPRSPNHRISVHRAVNRLPERLPIVADFKAHYREWFADGSTNPPPGHDQTPGEGLTRGSRRVPDTKQYSTEKNQSKGEAVDLDQETAGGADDASSTEPDSSTASPAAQGASANIGKPLPPNAQRVLRELYGIKRGVPLSDRQKQVGQDMRATLGDRGALLERGTYVRAVDAAHLDEACARVLSNGVRTPDAAFRLVLLELQKTWQETKAAREKAERGEEPARISGDGAPTPIGRVILPPAPIDGAPEAESWLGRLSVTEGGRRMAEVERLVRSRAKANTAPSERERMRTQALVEVWRAATQPKPATEGAA